MKPEKLILSGWGPYRDRVEIDFTGLENRGLFLITGATGAGKTTIFDAITYALYGNMSGETREKNSVRSDFADGDTPTFAELTMQHAGKHYRIVRNPEYMRPRKKKGGKGREAKEKENAVLWLPDGSVVEGSSEVNRRLQEILVLDYRQFKQISMIAQGEFARLLTASPAEKTKIFREIFDTAVYDRFAGILRSRANELYQQIMECRSRMEEDIHMLRLEEHGDGETGKQTEEDGSLYERIIEHLEKGMEEYRNGLEEAQKEYAAREREVTALTETITEAEQINEKLRKLEEQEELQKKWAGRKDEMDVMGAALKKARKAAGLNGDYVNLKNAGELLEVMEEKIKDSRRKLEDYRKQQQELAVYDEKKEEIREGYEVLAAYEECSRSLLEVRKRLKEKQEELDKLREDYLKQEEATGQKQREFETADQAYKRAAVGIAARQVREGEPCPVCGSVTHPRVAETAMEVPDEAELQKLQKSCEKERERLMGLHGRTAACQSETAGYMAQQEELERQAEEYRKGRKRITEETMKLLKCMSREAYEKKADDYLRVKAQTEEKRNRLAKDGEELEAQEKKRAALKESFERKYLEAGFASLKACEESIMPQAAQEDMERQIRDYQTKTQQLEERILHLKEETKGKKEKDAGELREKLKEKNGEKQRALKQLNGKSHDLQELKKVLSSLKEKEKKRSALSREYGIVKDLDNMASGNNAERLVFEQYVLAGYFEEILRAANLRLAKMTGGRYELSRVTRISDGRVKDNLEMQVFDYYTGKYRSVRTLSGGEAFKASLSLALGMSDVVQGYSGGIRVDTLFIDEGFGALDSESLDQACRTLMSLVEKDRLIGIISHVPELAEKIEKQIIITKTNIGSRVQVVV